MRCYNSRKWGVVRASVSECAKRYGRLLVLLQNLVEALATDPTEAARSDVSISPDARDSETAIIDATG